MAAVVADDTIAAIATASGVGGVGIVRVSGPAAIEIACDVLGVSALDRTVRVGWARDKAGTRIDQVLAFAMRAPASFTGEDVAELHGHGGAHNLDRLLGAVLERGARIAEPGEFTRRAVANGKLDLVRAEALLEVIHAGSERAWRLAQQNLGGRLGEVARELETRALGVLAEIEGRIDFPEEDIAPADASAIETELAAIAARCASLAGGFRHGRALSQGITVALVGPVNAGKSSLLNALVGKERALVAAAPGTTRDYLEVADVWSGVAVTIVDTAGTRVTADEIEARGIELGEQRVAGADVVIVVNDGSSAWDDGSRFAERALVIRSKADLGGDVHGALATSASTGQGLDSLKMQVLALAGVADREGSEDAFVTTARQQATAAAARDAFEAAVGAWRAGRVPEVVALEVRQGVHALAQLRGNEVGDRVLDEVFARFCIGK
ncbi:MAG: tRNA uridine-5-carboxymethylaminomethyl(34) synthesis GTPase MnmE [Kofleriaceae bacterium]|nr:tRNA uridine-5-carboxymethylaminomethyl(34) synthesis GTPase MnmE [Kofleriaceae bacterium]